VFVDDIVVWSDDFEQHKRDLQEVFARLYDQGFQLKLSKCSFFQKSTEYLGFIISDGKIAMDPKKVEAIKLFEIPKTKKGLQRFLGMCGWYRKFVKGFANIAKPLFELMSKDDTIVSFEGNEKAKGAFEELKGRLTSYPILKLPDFNKEFIVIPDGCNLGTGAVLAQEFNGFEHPVAYHSKGVPKRKKHRHSYYLETLALVRALKQWHHYLADKPFTVITDCRALAYWNSRKKDIPDDIARYLDEIQKYPILFVHRAGTKMVVPDALSREERTDEDEWKAMDVHREAGLNPEELTRKGRYRLADGDKVTALPVQLTERETTNATRGIPVTLVGHQSGDSWCVQMRHMLREEKVHPHWQRRIEGEARNYVLNGDLILRKITHKGRKTLVPYVPVGPVRTDIMTAIHNDPAAGHLGFKRSKNRIRKRFFWEGMDKDLKTHICNCPCKLYKVAGTNKSVVMQPLKIGAPFEDVHLDFCGPLPHTDKGHKYILVIVDRFTKWVELVPTKDNSMATAAAKFDKRVLKRFGTPRTVLVDNAFRGEFKELCAENGIFTDYALPYQHNTNGLAERMNRTIEEMLRPLVKDNIRDWPRWIPSIQAAINNAKATAHGYTPFALVKGWDPVLPIERLLTRESEQHSMRVEKGDEAPVGNNVNEEPGAATDKEDDIAPQPPIKELRNEEVTEQNLETVKEWKEVMDEVRQEIHEEARGNITRTQENMVTRDKIKKGNRIGEYPTGTWVLVRVHQPSSKLSKTKEGPYLVHERVEDRPANYVLQFMGIPGTEKTVHANSMEAWNGFNMEEYVAQAGVTLPDRKDRNPKCIAAIKRLMEKCGVKREQDLKLAHLIGKRIRVKWSGKDINGWQDGVIVAQEGVHVWVKYSKVRDADGLPYFLEGLLSNNGAQWDFQS
jgi:hypothetical protein